MSPEQARGEKVDARTDIFSLGAVLYEMAVGRAPFEGVNAVDVMGAILNCEPIPLKQHVPDAPDELQRIIGKVLRKDREERYQTAKDLLIDLRELKQNLEFEAKLGREVRDGASATGRSERGGPAEAQTGPLETVRTGEALKEHPTSISKSFVRRIRRYQIRAILVLAGSVIATIVWVVYQQRTAWDSVGKSSSVDDTAQQPARLKPYLQMTEEERTVFVEQQARRVSAMLGERPAPLSGLAVRTIKRNVDFYGKRIDSLSDKLWEDGLRIVFGRASQYAPIIVRSFSERGVPPIIGLYIPMIESEYRACVQSPTGAKGMFQFMPETAKEYGLVPEERCNIEKVAPAAAKYIADRMVEFGSDSMSMTLVILSFNMSPDGVRHDMRKLRRENPNLERSFWTLFDNANRLDQYFQSDIVNYVPRFFAAAIVGENPQSFNLQMPPLSMHTNPAN